MGWGMVPIPKGTTEKVQNPPLILRLDEFYISTKTMQMAKHFGGPLSKEWALRGGIVRINFGNNGTNQRENFATDAIHLLNLLYFESRPKDLLSFYEGRFRDNSYRMMRHIQAYFEAFSDRGVITATGKKVELPEVRTDGRPANLPAEIKAKLEGRTYVLNIGLLEGVFVESIRAAPLEGTSNPLVTTNIRTGFEIYMGIEITKGVVSLLRETYPNVPEASM